MEETFHSLGRILLNALPTFFILLFLILYLRAIFYKPLARILKQRYEATEGAQLAAQESMRQAEIRVADYEEKLRAARNEIYTEQNRFLKQIEHENALSIEHARREAEASVARGSAELMAEASEARRVLEARAGELAQEIVSRVLEVHQAA